MGLVIYLKVLSVQLVWSVTETTKRSNVNTRCGLRSWKTLNSLAKYHHSSLTRGWPSKTRSGQILASCREIENMFMKKPVATAGKKWDESHKSDRSKPASARIFWGLTPSSVLRWSQQSFCQPEISSDFRQSIRHTSISSQTKSIFKVKWFEIIDARSIHPAVPYLQKR